MYNITITNTGYSTETRLNGKLHSINGAPSITYHNGTQYQWHQHGTLYRPNNKPSIITDQHVIWTNTKGEPHNEKGPAFILHDSRKAEHWANGKQLNKKAEYPNIPWQNYLLL